MANSIQTTDGSAGFGPYALNFTLGILDRSYVTCRVNQEVDGSNNPVYRTLSWTTDGIVNIASGVEPTSSDTVTFTRTIPSDILLHDYVNGAVIEEVNLNESQEQCIMLIHQFLDGRLGTFGDSLDMGGNTIINVANGVNSTDAVNVSQLQPALDLISTANTAVTTATNEAAIATSQAAIATTKAATATTQAGIATTAANNAIAAAAQGIFAGHDDIAYANSPFTPALNNDGNLIRVDTSSGNVIINLSTLATYAQDMTLAFVKITNDANTVTINAGGSDTIGAGTSVLIDSEFTTHVLVGSEADAQWIDSVQSAPVTEDKLSFSDITTANASTSKHGLMPKLSGNSTDVMHGDGSWSMPTSGNSGYNAKTADYTLLSTDKGKLIDLSGASAAATFTTASAVALGDGWFCYIRNSDDYTLTLTTMDGTVDGVSSYPVYHGECRMVICDGTNFETQVLAPFNLTIDYAASPFTFTTPKGYAEFQCEIWGGGGGGSGGSSGGGGGGGAYNILNVAAPTMGTSQTVTIGAGGGEGVNGGTTSIGTLVYAYGGGNSHAGSTSGGGGGGVSGTGTTTTGGLPNTSPFTGAAGVFGLTGGAGAGGDSYWGGAGGGNNGANGGNSVYGGAGGGGYSSGVGGKSVNGGNGGNYAVAGSVPGGGGGCFGAGGHGRAIIKGIL